MNNAKKIMSPPNNDISRFLIYYILHILLKPQSPSRHPPSLNLFCFCKTERIFESSCDNLLASILAIVSNYMEKRMPFDNLSSRISF